MQTSPAYVHDCDPEFGCRFLGTMKAPAQHAPAGVPVLDLWVHAYERDWAYPMSLIFRWNDDGPEYESMPYTPGDAQQETYFRGHPVFAEILRRLQSQ